MRPEDHLRNMVIDHSLKVSSEWPAVRAAMNCPLIGDVYWKVQSPVIRGVSFLVKEPLRRAVR